MESKEALEILQVGDSSRPHLQEMILNISPRFHSNFLSLFKCPLTHIIPKRETFRERKKVYHSLFPHPFPLNSLLNVLEWNNLTKGVKMIEVQLEKTLNINSWLIDDQERRLFEILKANETSYAWDYSDMKGIDPRIYHHHIYTDESKPIQ